MTGDNGWQHETDEGSRFIVVQLPKLGMGLSGDKERKTGVTISSAPPVRPPDRDSDSRPPEAARAKARPDEPKKWGRASDFPAGLSTSRVGMLQPAHARLSRPDLGRPADLANDWYWKANDDGCKGIHVANLIGICCFW